MIEAVSGGASALPAAGRVGTEARAQPAFVLSCERSGSTLLRWLLDAHHEVASPGELRLGRLAYDLYVTLSRTVTVDVPKDSNHHVRETLREVRAVIDGILERYTVAKGKRVWCEKSPENLRYLEALTHTYPDGRYLCLHRSCLDVVSSCLDASRNGFMEELSDHVRQRPDNLVEAMAANWADKTSEILRFELRNASLCHRLRYEDLVTSPEETLGRAFEFLGVAPEPEAIRRAFSMSHDAGGGDDKIHESGRVTCARVGAGRSVPVDRIGTPLRRRVNALSRKLGYADL